MYRYERSMMIDKLIILSPITPSDTNAARYTTPYMLIDVNTLFLDELGIGIHAVHTLQLESPL